MSTTRVDERRWSRASSYDLETERQAELAYHRALVAHHAPAEAVTACAARIDRLEQILLSRRKDHADG